MDVKIFLVNLPQQRKVNIFRVGIQFLQYGHLMVEKINMVYTKMKIV